ncbi:hypothetical protein F6T13_22990 [Escherichia coli]|nr:hypothetical protein [Escherichia coli]EGF7454372.1 hypothetical protein [Escherichia coli]
MIARLPDTPCQHGSFTMPDTLWPLFEVNRWLLSGLFALPKVIARWIWNVRQYLLSAWASLTLPPVLSHILDYDEWQRFILSQGKNEQGEDYWHMYFAKPTKHACQTAK